MPKLGGSTLLCTRPHSLQLSNRPDFVALSFVQKAEDTVRLRQMIKDHPCPHKNKSQQNCFCSVKILGCVNLFCCIIVVFKFVLSGCIDVLL